MKGVLIIQKRKYSAEEKVRIVNKHIKHGESTRSLADKYGLHHTTVEEWIVQYKINGKQAFVEEENYK